MVTKPGKTLNLDPSWVRYVERFEPLILSISHKVTTDKALQQDCQQEARIALLQVYPEKVDGHEKFIRKEITEGQWHINLRVYCSSVIRNSMLDYLNSYKTGNWYIGRTRRYKNRTGEVVEQHVNPRFSSLDDLMENFGMQIDHLGEVTWEEVSTTGLLGETTNEATGT